MFYFLHCTSALSFYIDVVLTLSISIITTSFIIIAIINTNTYHSPLPQPATNGLFENIMFISRGLCMLC